MPITLAWSTPGAARRWIAGVSAGTVYLAEERHRMPAAVTFLVAASGIAVGGIGAAFWALVAGAVTLGVLSVGTPRSGSTAAR